MANEQSTWSSPEPAPLSIGKGAAKLGGNRGLHRWAHRDCEHFGVRRHTRPGARRAPHQRIHAAGAHNYPAETFARGKGMLNLIEVHRAELEGIETHHRALFEDMVRRHGIRSESEWRSLPYLSSEVGVHAYYADLVVIARPESASQTAGPPGLAESLS